MIHHSCDRCKQLIDNETDMRYVVRIEIQASVDGLDCEIEDDRDHLLEIEDILDRLEADESDDVSEEVYQRQKYDLCSKCFREFIKNPLKCEPKVQLGFSEN